MEIRVENIEITTHPDGTVTVTDWKSGDALTYDAEEWLAFVKGLRAGEFDASSTPPRSET